MSDHINEGRLLEELAYKYIYKPIYSRFSEQKYLPFYLHVLPSSIGAIVLIFFLTIAIIHLPISNIDLWLRCVLFFITVALIMGSIFFNIFRDIYFIIQNKRSFTLGNTRFCQRYYVEMAKGWAVYYHWQIKKIDDGNMQSLRMNIYQYRQVMGYNEFLTTNKKGKEYLIYYLPYTKLILKFIPAKQN